MKVFRQWVVLFVCTTLATKVASAQLPPTVKFTTPSFSSYYNGWTYNYSKSYAAFYLADTNFLQIMDGAFSTTPLVTITFDKAHGEKSLGGDPPDFRFIADCSGDGIGEVLISRAFSLSNRKGLRIVDGATGSTLWIFDDTELSYFILDASDLDHDGKTELVIGKSPVNAPNTHQYVAYATNGVAAAVLAPAVNAPSSFKMGQNYPNPFNPSTTIDFQLPVKENVNITIYDNLGRVVRIYSVGQQEAGTHSFRWDARNESGESLASGSYFYQAHIGANVQTKKMLIIK